jgi:glycosyltransferase involved in cell wall biosynthesis
MRLRATVVIPTHDRASTLGLMLPHVLEQSIPRDEYEIIVVDDESADETPDVLRPFERRGVRWIRQLKAGAGPARNKAVAASSGAVVVFLDDDAFVAPDFLERHLAAHAHDGRVLAAGGIIEVREPAAPNANPPRWAGYHRHPMPGGNSSVRREHLLAVGGFDESFNTYGWQDQELAERLLRLGLKRRFVPGAPIHHYKPADVVLDARHELTRELERGRMGARFYHKHPSPLVGITTKLWPPLRAADALLTRAFGLDRQAERILAGAETLAPFRGARASLLRAHVEIAAGKGELAVLRARSASGDD